jgi:hexosaminidase
MAALFPCKYIHIGGDEAYKGFWEKDPKCIARMKKEHLTNVDELQSYFVKRIEKMLQSKGKKLIGWDEILEGGLAPDATVMSWRGIDGAIAAAKAGHDTVLSPAPDLYFDHWQSQGDTSPGRSNTLSLKDVYLFNPLPAAILPEQRKHVLGLQANLWAEFMRSEARVTYMAYPRVAALAEVAWSPQERINWEEFEKRLEPQLRRYATLGIGYARETPVVPAQKRRVSHDLDQCGGGYVLSLEDDAPVQGERAVFRVNITDPCWIWKGVDLSQVKAIRATVGQIPFNFQIGADATKIPLRKPATKYGEFEIRIDDCNGKLAASGSLEPAVSNHGLTPLPPIDLPSQEGQHDLCFTFTRARIDPIWVIGGLELIGY